MINSEVKKLLTTLTENQSTGEISAKFAFPASFIGFMGHFPGQSILPGVCQVEMITAVISTHLNCNLTLLSVSRAKFRNIVRPEEVVCVSGSYSVIDNIISGKFKITKEENKENINVSQISLKCEIRKDES